MLIFNALAQRRGVTLPGIGSLYVVTEAARMQEGGKLIPPISRVRYTTEPMAGYDDILRLIGESSGRDEAGSREIYEAWLSEVQTEEGFRMNSIGEIVGGQFKPTEELLRTLNPSGTFMVQLPRPFSLRQIFFWVGATVVVGGGLAAGLITYLNSRPGPYDAPYAEGTPVAESVMTGDTLLRGTVAGADAEPSLEALTENDLAAQAVAGDSAGRTGAQSSSAGSGSSSVTAVQTAQNRPKSEAEATAGRSSSVKASEAPKPGEMRYYVVVGTYSTDENAERFIASARRKAPTPNYRKLLLSTGKIMVYTADAGSEAEAQQQRRAVSEAFPDAWVFKRRAR